MRRRDTRTLAQAAEWITAVPAPVVVIDACSFLDIVRAPLRGRHSSVEAAMSLAELASAEPTGVHLAVTSTIHDEWAQYQPRIRAEVDDVIRQARETLEGLRRICPSIGIRPPHGVSGTYDRIPSRLVRIASRLHDLSMVLADDEVCQLRAFRRHAANLRPARKGQSTNDCAIIEHVLGLCGHLRAGSFGEIVVFVSSNTTDYCAPDGKLHPDLEGDFDAAGQRFVTNLAWARSLLGR